MTTDTLIPVRTCARPGCDQELVRGESENAGCFVRRRYCCRACSNRDRSETTKAAAVARRQQAILDDIAEIEWLLECREWPPRIVVRVGRKNAEHLAKWLRAHGRRDLAAHFGTKAMV
jgi:hypothetical protein